jgi:hypothetical protein
MSTQISKVEEEFLKLYNNEELTVPVMDLLISIATKCPEFKNYPLKLIKLLISHGNDGWHNVVDRYVKEKRTDLYKDMEKEIVKDIYEAVPIVLGLYMKQGDQREAYTANNK